MSASAYLLVLTDQGAATATQLRESLPDGRARFTIEGLAGRVTSCDTTFDDTIARMQALFRAGHTIVALCSAGIVVRALAPLLADKTQEPPVLALSEDGRQVVPLLGGHRGANDLARELATASDGTAAITTAGDLRFGVALDAPPPGYRLANPQDHKAFAAELLSGAFVVLEGDAPWLVDSRLPIDAAGSLRITVSTAPSARSARHLVYHPKRVALGLGCERGASLEELEDLADRALTEAALAWDSVAAIVSIDLKVDEQAVHDLALKMGVPARFFSAQVLEGERDRLVNPSDAVFQEVGCHGVAEGAALAAVGPKGGLRLPKIKSVRATAALAVSPQILNPAEIGRARGSLAVVGLGPGASAWRTPEADAAIRAAGDLVGYSLYLDLLGPLAEGKRRHDFGLGEEQLRVRAALTLAAEGRDVALICSGDPGIYAMASLVFEELEKTDDASWWRPELRVVPGISALQAAAARIGAPLGHDFCAISLSDLLTPWETIEQRLKAAAQGDFVVAFYNPISRQRSWQLEKALDILRGHRPGKAPVVLARNLGREGERVTETTLAAVTADMADMLTVILVGSSQSRRITGGGAERSYVYTPRGYAAKERTS
jgi:cobalt-precorrin 5A hydrolase/precorrin-3B C17-methyltransferase